MDANFVTTVSTIACICVLIVGGVTSIVIYFLYKSMHKNGHNKK